MQLMVEQNFPPTSSCAEKVYTVYQILWLWVQCGTDSCLLCSLTCHSLTQSLKLKENLLRESGIRSSGQKQVSTYYLFQCSSLLSIVSSSFHCYLILSCNNEQI